MFQVWQSCLIWIILATRILRLKCHIALPHTPFHALILAQRTIYFQTFARTVHDNWGVGSRNCNNGLLLFLAYGHVHEKLLRLSLFIQLLSFTSPVAITMRVMYYVHWILGSPQETGLCSSLPAKDCRKSCQTGIVARHKKFIRGVLLQLASVGLFRAHFAIYSWNFTMCMQWY